MKYKKPELTQFAKDCAWGSKNLINGICMSEEVAKTDLGRLVQNKYSTEEERNEIVTARTGVGMNCSNLNRILRMLKYKEKISFLDPKDDYIKVTEAEHDARHAETHAITDWISIPPVSLRQSYGKTSDQ